MEFEEIPITILMESAKRMIDRHYKIKDPAVRLSILIEILHMMLDGGVTAVRMHYNHRYCDTNEIQSKTQKLTKLTEFRDMISNYLDSFEETMRRNSEETMRSLQDGPSDSFEGTLRRGPSVTNTKEISSNEDVDRNHSMRSFYDEVCHPHEII